MNNQLIKSTLQETTYRRKEGRSTSYAWTSGAEIFPKTLTITRDLIQSVAKKGRNLSHSAAGQMLGRFTKKEESILKKNPPFKVRTQIWSVDEFPLLIGYGTIGTSDDEGKITRKSDLGDLVVFHTSDNWETIRIFFLPKMLEYRDSVMEYLSSII